MAIILVIFAVPSYASGNDVDLGKIMYPHHRIPQPNPSAVKDDAKAKAIPEDTKAKEVKPEPKETPPNPDIISRPDQNVARPDVPVHTETPQADRPVKPAPSGKPELSGTKPDKNPAQNDRAASPASPREKPVPRDQAVMKRSPADRDQAVPSDPARRDFLAQSERPLTPSAPLTEEEIKAKIKEGQAEIQANNRKAKWQRIKNHKAAQAEQKKEEKAIAPTAAPTAAPDSGAAVQTPSEMDDRWTEEDRIKWRDHLWTEEELKSRRERHRDGLKEDWRERHSYFVPQPDWREKLIWRQEHPRRYSYFDTSRRVYFYPEVISTPDRRASLLPTQVDPVSVAGRTYYYADGMYYERDAADYTIVPPPVGAVVGDLPPEYAEITVSGTKYSSYNGVFYKKSGDGYEVTAPPRGMEGVLIATAPRTVNGEEAILVDIPDPEREGSFIEVKLVRFGEGGFRGPQGETYAQFPDIGDLVEQYEQYHYRIY